MKALVANSTLPRQEQLDCIPVRAELNIKSMNLDKTPGYNSIGFVTLLKGLEKWKSRFVGELERFELAPRGQGQILQSGSVYIYISQLLRDHLAQKIL